MRMAVVDEDVDAAPLLDGGVNELLAALGRGHAGVHGDGLPTCGDDLVGGGLCVAHDGPDARLVLGKQLHDLAVVRLHGGPRLAVVGDHLATLARQIHREVVADARTRARDNGNATVKMSHGSAPLVVGSPALSMTFDCIEALTCSNVELQSVASPWWHGGQNVHLHAVYRSGAHPAHNVVDTGAQPRIAGRADENHTRHPLRAFVREIPARALWKGHPCTRALAACAL